MKTLIGSRFPLVVAHSPISVAVLAVVFPILTGVGVAGAQNAISAPVVVANAGDTSVAVIFSATTDRALNVLAFTVTFDSALCGMIANEKLLQNGRSRVAPLEMDGCSPVPGPGKLITALLELNSTFSCNDDPWQFCDTDAECQLASGDPFDFCSSAVPAGTGGIAEWQFDVLPGATGAVFPLTVTINPQTAKGPLHVNTCTFPAPSGTCCTTDADCPVFAGSTCFTFTATSGQLTIIGPPTSTPTNTPTQTPTATDTPTNAPTKTPSAGDLLAQLSALVDSRGLEKGLTTDLQNKLGNAGDKLAKGHPRDACQKLDEFIKKVNGEAGKNNPTITATQASQLIAPATQIQATIGC
jgi:hypothetical protein